MLSFIRHVNQIIELRTLQIATNHRLELILVELNQFADSVSERVQQFPRPLAIEKPGGGVTVPALFHQCLLTARLLYLTSNSTPMH